MQWHNHHRHGGETKPSHPPFSPFPDYQPPLLLFFPSHEMVESERSVASMREALGGERRKEERERERERERDEKARCQVERKRKKKITGPKKDSEMCFPPPFCAD